MLAAWKAVRPLRPNTLEICVLIVKEQFPATVKRRENRSVDSVSETPETGRIRYYSVVIFPWGLYDHGISCLNTIPPRPVAFILSVVLRVSISITEA